MSTNYGATGPSPDDDQNAGNLVDTYVAALVAGDAETALATLSPDAVFQSPFHTWRARHLPSVFRARCRAFTDMRTDTVVRGEQAAAVLWCAAVDGCSVQAAEVVTIGDHAICRVDVFLRPAGVLDTVERAMVRSWPR